MREKYARWTSRVLPGQTNPTRRYALRRGKRGTGHQIGMAIEVWIDSPRSGEEGELLLAEVEWRAKGLGYTILPEEGEDE